MSWRPSVGSFCVPLLLALAPDAGVAQDDLYSRPVVLSVPKNASVQVERDLVYERSDGEELLMDLYRPGDWEPDARLPVVFFVHGGPLPDDFPGEAKDMGAYRSYGRHVAARGMAAVTFSHRFRSPEMLPTAAEDVAAAFRYVREHAAELSLDGDRICVWAVSGGGNVVAPFLRDRSGALRCLVLFYAFVDPSAMEELGVSGVPDGFAEEYDATEALAASADGSPRIVVARGGRDYEPLNRALDGFVTAALQADVPLDLMNHPRGEHAFDLLNDDERSREIIRRSLEIVRSVLSP